MTTIDPKPFNENNQRQLPLVAPDSATGHASDSSSLASVRILLVEDGATNRKVIRLILQRAGASIEMAENGQIGVELAEKNAYDLILMDIQMPVMDGLTATQIILSQTPNVPIVALTAHAMKEDEEKCRAAGFVGFLTKPIGADRLVEEVMKFLLQAKTLSGADESPSLAK